jgi:hypothetical protein
MQSAHVGLFSAGSKGFHMASEIIEIQNLSLVISES